MEPKKIKLTIDSDLTHVFLVGLAVNKICSHIPLTELQSYQIETCVVEAVNNTIKLNIFKVGQYPFDSSKVLIDISKLFIVTLFRNDELVYFERKLIIQF